jgi:uncharacterized glyoxalase superfamily protein PhnB
MKKKAKKSATKKAGRAKPLKAQPVPKGYHTVTPYLVCRDASRAIDFYKRALGAKEKVRMPGPGGKVMHAELRVGDSMVMLCDEMPEMGAKSPEAYGGSPMTVFLYVKNVDQAFSKATAAGAAVVMPVQDMFWGDRYGRVRDPFGHEWQMATHKEDLTPRQIGERAKAAMPPG